jgi:hypothetical protein
MDRDQFEAQLKADGFQEIEHTHLTARPGKGRHRHLFVIRGLVTAGTFVVLRTDEPVSYGPGQVFEVAHGDLHDEWIGLDGASVVIGRRFSVEQKA